MTGQDESFLQRVAERLGQPPSYAEVGDAGSILAASATSYGSDDVAEGPGRTDFDPVAAALFEALVESAFLVANADGEFDAAEREVFQHVVMAACGGTVAERQIRALIADLEDLLLEDGFEQRVRMVARAAARPEHAREVLRVAALLAHASGGVSDAERDLIEKLAGELRLGPETVTEALGEAELCLAG
jgi:tellurite resistance protein